MCGVHRTYMGHIERGEKNVSFMSIVRVANALNVGLPELFAGLETGEQPTAGAKRKRKSGISGRGRLDRDRLLRAVAVLERSVHTLRELALSEGERLPPKAEPRLSKRRGRRPELSRSR